MTDNDDFEMANNAETLLDAGEVSAGVSPRLMKVATLIPEDDGVYAVLEQDGHSKRVKLASDIMAELDKRAPGPRDRRGTTQLHEIKSLIAYVNRYKTENAIAYANVASFRVDVVLDDHPAGSSVTDTAWRAHRASYTCPRSVQWDAWTRLDGQAMPQEKFADFIEARLEDISAQPDHPKPLDMLTMARNLIVRTKGTFERQIDPTTGNGVLINKAENDTGSTVIPRAFMLAIPVFEGGIPYLIEARIRMVVADGRASFSFTLHRRTEIERAAFQEVRDEIEEQCSIPVLAGTP